MVKTKKLILDVLKPLRPNILEFAQQLNAGLAGAEVNIKVMGVDEKTQDVTITLQGCLDYDTIAASITALGASIHSIDEVVTHHVESAPPDSDQ